MDTIAKEYLFAAITASYEDTDASKLFEEEGLDFGDDAEAGAKLFLAEVGDLTMVRVVHKDGGVVYYVAKSDQSDNSPWYNFGFEPPSMAHGTH